MEKNRKTGRPDVYTSGASKQEPDMAEQISDQAADDLKLSIPVWEKPVLTLKEAAAYSNIGINRLREIASGSRCTFALSVGNRKLIKRKEFERFLESQRFL